MLERCCDGSVRSSAEHQVWTGRDSLPDGLVCRPLCLAVASHKSRIEVMPHKREQAYSHLGGLCSVTHAAGRVSGGVHHATAALVPPALPVVQALQARQGELLLCLIELPTTAVAALAERLARGTGVVAVCSAHTRLVHVGVGQGSTCRASQVLQSPQ